MFLSPQSARRNLQDVVYPGQPLSPYHIRLIRLLPGTWTDPIRCELFERHSSTTRYQALSYVWGSQNVTRPILLNNKEFPVTFNLEGALRHLREHFKDGREAMVFWIDALCINQKDVEERTIQVQLMGSIYKNCQQVVVYLGDRLDGRPHIDKPPAVTRFGKNNDIMGRLENNGDTSDVCAIFSMFQAFAENKHLTEIPAFISNALGGDTGSHQLDLFEALRRMMHPPFTPWWSRIWVVQEVCVAPQVLIVYGTASIPWATFDAAAVFYLNHSKSCCSKIVAKLPHDQAKVLLDCCRRILDITDLRLLFKEDEVKLRSTVASNYRVSLLTWLRKFRNRRATDQRDKVYALLNLPRALTAGPSLKPDYSLNEVEVFHQATLRCIYETGGLSVFNSDLGRKFRNDLPSWVPDWSAPGGPIYEARAAAAELYHADPSGGLNNEELVHPVGKDGLQVKGSSIGRITTVDGIMWGGDVASIWRDTLSSWSLRISDVSTPDGKQDFWRFFCGDIICLNENPIQYRRMQSCDELTLMTWASESQKSPIAITHDAFWSTEAKIWRDIQVLWPQQKVLTWIEQRSTEDLIPYGLAKHEQDRRDMIQTLLHFLGDDNFETESLSKLMNAWKNLPWRNILNQLRVRLAQKFGEHGQLDPEFHRERIPNIDTSITAATLSRRLIVSGPNIGLGPADTQVGDELFFLKGGKTPFVLRKTSAEPELYGPKYELVGDCYIQDLMDTGRNPVMPDDGWATITLL
jgi:hypothetical protein